MEGFRKSRGIRRQLRCHEQAADRLAQSGGQESVPAHLDRPPGSCGHLDEASRRRAPAPHDPRSAGFGDRRPLRERGADHGDRAPREHFLRHPPAEVGRGPDRRGLPAIGRYRHRSRTEAPIFASTELLETNGIEFEQEIENTDEILKNSEISWMVSLPRTSKRRPGASSGRLPCADRHHRRAYRSQSARFGNPGPGGPTSSYCLGVGHEYGLTLRHLEDAGVDGAEAFVGQRASVGAREERDDPVLLRGIVEAEPRSLLIILQALHELDAFVQRLEDLEVVIGDLLTVALDHRIGCGRRHGSSSCGPFLCTSGVYQRIAGSRGSGPPWPQSYLDRRTA